MFVTAVQFMLDGVLADIAFLRLWARMKREHAGSSAEFLRDSSKDYTDMQLINCFATPRKGLFSVLMAASLLVACGGSDEAPPAPPMTTAEACLATALSREVPAVTSTAPAPATPEPTASTGATPRDQLPAVEFVRAAGGSICLPVELVPRDEFHIGLSGRYELDDRGMLFYYNAPHRGSFWMKNTHVDLSIAFVGADSRIVEIQEMYAETLHFVTPSVEYVYAIEAQPGWYGRNSVAVGDEVRFLFELPPELSGTE